VQGASEIWSVNGLEVRVPANAELRDYPLRIAEVLRALVEMEARPREEILRDLRDPRVDVVNVRLLADVSGGTTPLREGLWRCVGCMICSSLPRLRRCCPPRRRCGHRRRGGSSAGCGSGSRRLEATAPGGNAVRRRHPPLRFDERRVTRLRDAGDHLRTLRITEDARIEGLVVELRRESPDVPGTAVIDGVVHTGDRDWRDRVVLHLADRQSDVAVLAHRAAAAAGQLVRTENQLELREVQLTAVNR
jgi:hypothetical protein